jgi:3-hydroxybutyryl-CoA dehydratase
MEGGPGDPERGAGPDPASPRAAAGGPAGKTVAELALGMTASATKTYGEWDILTFAAVTGDINPAHVNEAFAQETVFQGKVAHGLLTASLISAVLGTQLPGPGTIYLGQELRFRRPVRIGDTITATVQVTELIPEKNLARLRTTCANQRGEVVLEGTAVVMPPTRK